MAASPTLGVIQHELYGNRYSKKRNHLYIVSYLIVFSILRTLARLGLQALMICLGVPVIFSELWVNMGGSLIMGFLSEDRSLFQREWKDAVSKARQCQPQEADSPIIDKDKKETDEAVIIAAVKAHKAAKRLFRCSLKSQLASVTCSLLSCPSSEMHSLLCLTNST